MGISVLSPINLSGTVSTNSGIASEASAATGDFASLFIEQLSASITGLVSASEESSELIPSQIIAKEDEGDIHEDTSNLELSQLGDLAALNPALFTQVTSASKTVAQDGFDAGNGELLNEKKNLIPNLVPNANDSTEKIAATQLKASQIDSSSGADKKAGDFSEIFANSRIANSLSTSASTARSQGDPAGISTLPESANFAASPTPPEGGSLSAMGTAGLSHSIRPHEYNPLGKMEISTPIHESQWASNLGEKIVWLARNDQQTAQININPPQLGPMQISLNMNGDQATAMFASPHAEVRQAIEDAMPRLREMLSSSGISLGDANVGTQLPQQNRDNAPQFANASSNGGRITNENDILGKDSQIGGTSGTMPILRGRGLVDLFA